jgi:hypothetical protein
MQLTGQESMAAWLLSSVSTLLGIRNQRRVTSHWPDEEMMLVINPVVRNNQSSLSQI